jgi:hypothetical protein
MPKNITALTDLETIEVSLVKKGANRKPVAFVKEIGSMPKTKEEIIKAVLETATENEVDLEAQIKAANLSDEATLAISVAARAITGFADAIPETAHELIAKALGLKLKTEPVKVPVDPISELTPEAKALFAKAQATADEATKKAEAVQKSLDSERLERRTKEFVTKAAEYPKIGGDLSKTGELLRRVADLDAGLASHLESVLKSAEEIAAKSALFVSVGTTQVAEELDAYGKIKKAASEIRKSHPEMSEVQAIRVATEQNPELAKAYRAERN